MLQGILKRWSSCQVRKRPPQTQGRRKTWTNCLGERMSQCRIVTVDGSSGGWIVRVKMSHGRFMGGLIVRALQQNVRYLFKILKTISGSSRVLYILNHAKKVPLRYFVKYFREISGILPDCSRLFAYREKFVRISPINRVIGVTFALIATKFKIRGAAKNFKKLSTSPHMIFIYQIMQKITSNILPDSPFKAVSNINSNLPRYPDMGGHAYKDVST
jgi:hypothetical protein